MDGVKLMDKARAAGLKVWAEGDKLVIRGPRIAELVAKEILAHKSELLPLLLASQPSANPDDFSWLLGMSLAEFAGQRLSVRVYSEILREEIVFAGTPEIAAKAMKAGFVAYTPDELRELWMNGLHDEDLRRVHQVKKTFCGAVQRQGEERP